MIAYSKKILFLLNISVVLTFIGCKKDFSDDNFVAYFGGEVINPKNNYVLFMKDDEVIDTLYLNKKNQFLKKFDSLAPGMYTFMHEPEYQYVYFDKNDSLMVRINSVEFDESVVFCGRGDEKNNFLMELYLKNEDDKNKMFDLFDYPVKKFVDNIDSSYQSKKRFYNDKKKKMNWSEDFDLYAKSMLDFHHFAKKEIYPMAHKMRTGKNVTAMLPVNYYNHRGKIEFNNKLLTTYSPFVRYLTHMMSNVSFHELKETNLEEDVLELHLHKLNIADTLFKNGKTRNKILNNIAFSYLLEDQDVSKNAVFIDRYNQLSTDKNHIEEINKIGGSIQQLKKGNELPEIPLIDLNGKKISSKSILNKKSVVFFWTKNADSHMISAHKKALDFMKKNPTYQYIAINMDDNQGEWKKILETHQFGNINEFRANDFEELKEKWVITKLHRVILLDENGKIDNGFVNLFDVKFEKLLH